MPRVSVILITYNGKRTLPWAIGSVMAQDFTDWELLVIDDGSTDGSETLLKSIADPRVKYFRLSQNSGRGAARREGLERAAGEYIAFVDADDWLYPDKLAFQVSFLDSHPDVELMSCSMAICSRDGELRGVRRLCPDGQSLVFPPTRFPRKPRVPFPPSMVRTKLARRIGFNAHYRISEDAPFLTDCCMGSPSAVDGRIGYAYVEDEPTPAKAVRSAWAYCGFLLQRLPRWPSQCTLLMGRYCVAIVFAGVLHVTRCWGRIVKSRSVSPTGLELARHRVASDRIQALDPQFAVIKEDPFTENKPGLAEPVREAL